MFAFILESLKDCRNSTTAKYTILVSTNIWIYGPIFKNKYEHLLLLCKEKVWHISDNIYHDLFLLFLCGIMVVSLHRTLKKTHTSLAAMCHRSAVTVWSPNRNNDIHGAGPSSELLLLPLALFDLQHITSVCECKSQRAQQFYPHGRTFIRRLWEVQSSRESWLNLK